jgi:glycosyltransferase involved in cell wall biosynthesis/lysophospholipase L1-like esterase
MPEKIHVLFLHSQNGFGADSAIHGFLMRYLDRERFVVHLACSQGDGTGVPPSLARFREIPDVRIRPTQFAPGFRHRSPKVLARGILAAATSPLDFLSLAHYVRHQHIRVIHGTDRPRDAVYAVSLAKLTGAKSVVHVHVAWSTFYSAPAKWAVRSADGVFSISRFVTETVVATGADRARVHTILNGIDPSRWDPALDGQGIRREFGVPHDAPLLASVSRLFAQKGQRELVRALALVRKEVPNVRLLVVGADALEVHGSSFTEELKVIARELGVADSVVFTGERSDVPEIMAACDVFTLPSFEEPFGLVFLEAMAMRRPVVALDNGGAPEVVEHGLSGLLSPAEDVDALARNILTLLKDPELRARMGAHGRARVLEYFTGQRMARDAGRAYEAKVSSLYFPPPRLSLVLTVALVASLAMNAILVASVIKYFKSATAIRLDPAGLDVYAADRVNEPAGGPLVIFFGDSRALMWPEPAAATGYRMLNHGIGYQTTEQILMRVDDDVVRLRPTVVVLEAGVNDLKAIAEFPARRAQIVADCEANLERIVDRCRRAGATVVLVTVFDIGDVSLWRRPLWSADVAAAVRDVNAYLPKLAGDHVVLFEAAPVLDDDKGTIQKDYQLDYLHLSAAGYSALNRKLLPLLSALPK